MTNIHHLYSLIQKFENRLSGFVHPDIMREFLEIKKLINDETQEKFKQEQMLEEQAEEKFDRQYELFLNFKNQSGFFSIWSIDDIDFDQLNDVILDENSQPILFNKIEYEGQVINFDQKKTMTYLEFWSVADQLIRLSCDFGHPFLEGFYEKNGGHELITGS